MSAVRTHMEHGQSGNSKTLINDYDIQRPRAMAKHGFTVVDVRRTGEVVLKHKMMSLGQHAEIHRPEVLLTPPMIPNMTV